MTQSTIDRTIAVIGFGPRGLGALEALSIAARSAETRFRIDILDPGDALGAGPNFHPDESPLCLLNIPVRVLDIDPPALVQRLIPPFDAWSGTTSTGEDFPPRRDLGAYMTARLEALCTVSEPVFETRRLCEKATKLARDAAGCWIITDEGRHGPYDEVLLCPGQPSTKPDPQLARWTDHAEAHDLTLMTAYPAKDLAEAAEGWQDAQVAIRGLGLSTHDVLRMLTLGLGGRFEDGRYIRSGREPRHLLPFSRDGLPPAPKPATAEIDALYDPTPDERKAFVAALEKAVGESPEAALKTICDALESPVGRIASAQGGNQTRADITAWLTAERDGTAAPETDDTVEALRTTIAMAHDRAAPTTGYVAGQLWRKQQNEIRSAFNSTDVAAETATALVKFDEGMKRFSYGPPVQASEQLLMLIEDGLVSLQTVDDPDIALDPAGWRLVEGDDALLARVMIDAVLPNPDLAQITAPLFVDAIDEGLITAVDEGFGAQTRPDGSLVTRDGETSAGLCLLGRMSLGSVIATDSLHDCFGASTHRWAEGVLARARG
ncbi:FAD/NAD(P)-binding protein [Gymnodinialimonas ceratoperidinii]|uniref:FAD/NAD(P)-binding protein n=1 Tax=Gymnodinialimonas ceratoperidinii TaxID=2856823 RepID=A0A8F6YBN6_9RHOB|nr:FAD/NAD(P)-binding domain-containing protein [Gymnodinialimonas ceratoperidinii]QXT38380.1 FAD/NAD(P)-binding protein [Gymnodinialimonas ceratoperidinii]